MQDSKAGVLTNAYDSSGRLSSVQFGGVSQTQARIDLSYDSRNELTGLTRYGDVAGTMADGTTSYVYDSTGNVTAITNKNSSAATLSYYDYQYDSANRVTQETWASKSTTGSLISGTHTYAYDPTSQLTSADGANYSYDANGNRTMSGYETATNNRLTTDGTYTYTYDTEDTLTEKQAGGSNPDTWLYTYDQRNLLTSVVDKSNGTTVNLTLTYTYDALGRRVQQVEWKSGVGSTNTRFAMDANGQEWAELDGLNTVTARFLSEGEQQVLARIDNIGVNWLLTDHLGSVRDLVLGSASTVEDHIEYSAYGTISSEANASVGGSILYTGLWYNRDSGLYEAAHRWYNPNTGRWTTEDPMGFGAGDPNLQRYVRNDAINNTDPSGLQDLKNQTRRDKYRKQNAGRDSIDDGIELQYDLAIDDWFGPLNRIYKKTLKEIADDIDKRLKNGDKIKLIQIGSHGSSGLLTRYNINNPPPDDLILSHSDLKRYIDWWYKGNRDVPKVTDTVYRDYENGEALKRIAARLANDGTLELMSCKIFRDEDGKKLKKSLEEIFGKGKVWAPENEGIWSIWDGKWHDK